MAGFNPPLIFQKATDAQGQPAPGAKLYHYVTQTTILKDIFADFELTTPLPQPLVASSDGSFQQYFMEPGYYKFVLLDQYNNQLLPPQDHVCGAGAGGTAPEDDHKVLVDETDTTPGYLYEKLEDTTGLFWYISGAPGGVHSVRGEIQPGAGDTYKVKGSVSDATPGFLADKISDSNTVDLSVVDNKLVANVTGPYTVKVDETDTEAGYLYEKLEDTTGLHWVISGVEGGVHHVRGEIQEGAGDTYKVKQSASDSVPGYLGTKITGGTGIVLNTTSDSTNGTVIHINATNTANAKVKVNASDVTAGYLEDKLSAGSGITLTTVDVGGGYREVRIASTALGYQQAARDSGNLLRTTSTIPVDVLSLTLTAGTWEVCGSATGYIQPTGTVNVPGIAVNITTTPGASIGGQIPLDGYDVYAHIRNVSTAMTVSGTVSRRRFVLTATTTVYLNAQCRFGEFAFCDFWGNLTARQVA